MARYTASMLDEIKGRLDIVEVVSRYVRLHRAGKRLRGLCPFHSEKTPSFYVNPDGQFFHCFGCKESGDAISFVQSMEKLDFPDAVARLAEEVGVNLEVARSPEAQKAHEARENLYKLLVMAKAYFRAHLRAPGGAAARRYLDERGIPESLADRFELGYAPAGWRHFIAHCRKQHVPVELAAQAGLVIARETGRSFDFFRNRLMFPIKDTRGRVVAFGGRMLPGGDQPKYQNSPESPVFQKRSTLYGLYEARDAARREGRLIVVEGYTDVLGLVEAGVEHVVAALGTAFTEFHARELARWADEVVLAFDSDAAGRSAAARGWEALTAAGLRVRVATFPEGHDPDSLRKEAGPAALRDRLDRAIPLLEYQMEEALRSADLHTVEGRSRATQALLPVLARIQSPVEREGYLQRAAARLLVSGAALAAELAAYEERGGKESNSRHRFQRSRYTMKDSGRTRRLRTALTATERLTTARDRLERDLLRALLVSPDEVAAVTDVLGERPFERQLYNRMLEWLAREDGEQTVRVDRISDPELSKLAAQLLAQEGDPVLDAGVYAERLWEERVRVELSRLEEHLQRVPTGDTRAYVEEIGRLLQAYHRLRLAVAVRTPQ